MALVSEKKFYDRAKSILGDDMSFSKDEAFSEISKMTYNSKEFRESFYKIPFPKIEGSGIGYASDVPDISYTVRSGLANIRLVDKLWRNHRDNKESYKVLDFGSGSGRLLRFPNEFGENIELHGCDVNPKAVEWLMDNFSCNIHLIDKEYDISFAGGGLDLVYCWSIFTHFSEDTHEKWLEAIFDQISPGGIFMATFKKTEMIDRIKIDENYRRLSRAEDIDLEELEKEASSGFAYFECYEKGKSSEHGIDASTFGQTYISYDYIKTNWSKYGEVLHLGPAVENWQDIAVIKKFS